MTFGPSAADMSSLPPIVPGGVDEDDYLDSRVLLKAHKAAFPGLPTWNPDRVIQYVSPGHITEHILCPRRRYGSTVLGLKSPSTSSLKLGSEVHEIIERYAKERVVPAGVTQAECVALAGERFWPDPDRVAAGEIHIEHEFLYTPEGLPVPFYGLIDVWEVFEHVIKDHKTTSDFKYCKSKYELQMDPQAVTYGGYALSVGAMGTTVKGEKYIDFQHNYMRTRSPVAREERVRLYQENLEKHLHKMVTFGNEIINNARLPINEVPFKTDACDMWPPHGCPVRDLCIRMGVPVGGASFISHLQADLLATSHQGDLIMGMPGVPSFLQDIMNKREAMAKTATSVDELEKLAGEGEAPQAPRAAAPTPVAPPRPPPVIPAVPAGGVPRPAPVPVAIVGGPTINPPDGFPRDEPGTLDGVEPPEQAQTELTATVEARAAAENEAKKAAKEAQKGAKAAAGVGLPGGRKKKAPEESVTSETEQPAEPVRKEPWPIEAYLEESDKYAAEILNVARKNEDFQKALGEMRAASTQLMKLTEDTPVINAKAKELEATDEDAADELKAEHTKALNRAERQVNRAREFVQAAAENAAATAATEAAARAAAEAAEAAERVAAPKVVTLERATKEESVPSPVVDIRDLSVLIPAESGGNTGKPWLYIGGRPQRSQVVLWEDFIAPYIARAEAARKTPHIRLLAHDANAAITSEILADLRSGKAKLPSLYIMMYNSGLHGSIVESLATYFEDIVR